MQFDFQDGEVRRVAQEVVEHTTNTITKAIIKKLGIEDTYVRTNDDGSIETLPVEFERAYKLLREAGYVVQHSFEEEDKKIFLAVSFYKLESETFFDVANKYEYSLTERA